MRPPASDAMQQAFITDYLDGASVAEIAEKYAVGLDAVHVTLRKANVYRSNARRKRSDAGEFTYPQARFIDSLRNGIAIETAAHLAKMTLAEAEAVQQRAKRICRL